MFGSRLADGKKLLLPEPHQALPGREQPMPVTNEHAVLKTPLLPPYPEQNEQAMFGMGCFWGAEKLFWQLGGVYTTAVGYAGGYTPNPSYEEVCSGMTGHNEVVLVVFNPAQLSFQQLLATFWQSHNPTQGMRQGNDVGTQYRSAVYVFNDEQKRQAEESLRIYQDSLAQHHHPQATTEIVADVTFYFAEDYHQQYLAKNPHGYCPNHTCKATGLPVYPTK